MKLLILMSEISKNFELNFQKFSRNLTYIFKVTLNALLVYIKDYIQHVIMISETGLTLVYQLMKYWFTHLGRTWYCCTICSISLEKLLEYAKCENIKGNTTAQLIIDAFVKSGLDPLMCQPWTYYGAGNMAFKLKSDSNQFEELTINQTSITVHHTNYICVYVKHPRSQRSIAWYALYIHLAYFSSFQLTVKEPLELQLQKFKK